MGEIREETGESESESGGRIARHWAVPALLAGFVFSTAVAAAETDARSAPFFVLAFGVIGAYQIWTAVGKRPFFGVSEFLFVRGKRNWTQVAISTALSLLILFGGSAAVAESERDTATGNSALADFVSDMEAGELADVSPAMAAGPSIVGAWIAEDYRSSDFDMSNFRDTYYFDGTSYATGHLTLYQWPGQSVPPEGIGFQMTTEGAWTRQGKFLDETLTSVSMKPDYDRPVLHELADAVEQDLMKLQETMAEAGRSEIVELTDTRMRQKGYDGEITNYSRSSQ